MGYILSVTNNKGGTGKTSISINLANALTNKKYQVLIVDADAQCNATDILMHNRNVDDSLYEIFEQQTNIQNCVYPTSYEKLDILPNVEETGAIELFVINRDGFPEAYKILRNNIREYVINHYDFVIIDNPPNIGFFVANSLYCSDFVIVPSLAGSNFSLKGLKKSIELIQEIKKTGNPDLQFLRLLINGVDKRTTASRVTIDQIKRNFTEKDYFQTTIPSNTTVQRAELNNSSVFKYEPNSPASRAYRNLAYELLEIINL